MDWLQTGYIVNGHFMGYGKKIEFICRLRKGLDQVLISIQEFPPKSWKLLIWIPLIRWGNLSTVFWFSDYLSFGYPCWIAPMRVCLLIWRVKFQNFSASNWLFRILYTPLYWLSLFNIISKIQTKDYINLEIKKRFISISTSKVFSSGCF